MSRGPLLIVGASGRAAAASARRAGFDPFVIDLFADADTRRLCPTLHCPLDQYPAALPELARHAPPGPWIYTGGLENRPDILEQITATRDLLGNGPDVLATVRNPYRLHELLAGKGLTHPWLNHPDLNPPPTIRWLRKPLAGSGGFGVRFATDDDVCRASDPGVDFFLQEFVTGPPMSSAYITNGGRVAGVGTTRQLIGETWLHAKPFRYAGNVGPITPKDGSATDPFLHAFRLGSVGGMRGLWGIDFIPRAGDAFLLEVNPRYTASVEVLEYAHRTAFLSWHAEAIHGWPTVGFQLPPPVAVVGKAVYYAPHKIIIPSAGPWDESLVRCTDDWHRPDFADVPDPGTVIEPGHPVLTILTEAATAAECLARLKSRAAGLDQLFGDTADGGAL